MDIEGEAIGLGFGKTVGDMEDDEVGLTVVDTIGLSLGRDVGVLEGGSDIVKLGNAEFVGEGKPEGLDVGKGVGIELGFFVGILLGTTLGEEDGPFVSALYTTTVKAVPNIGIPLSDNDVIIVSLSVFKSDTISRLPTWSFRPAIDKSVGSM